MSVCRPSRRGGLVLAALLLTLVPFVPAFAQQEGGSPSAAPSEVFAPVPVETYSVADTPTVAPVAPPLVPAPAVAPAPDVAAPLLAAPEAAAVAEPIASLEPIAAPEPVAAPEPIAVPEPLPVVAPEYPPVVAPTAVAPVHPPDAPSVVAPAVPSAVTSATPPAISSPSVAPMAVSDGSAAVEGASASATCVDVSKPLIFWKRMNVLVILSVLLSFLIYFTMRAQSGREMFIRRISGLSAIEDAVGRATEMGRGVLFVPGISDMDDIQTIAGVTILGHVAKKTAEYETPLFAPMTRAFVMSVAQEVVKQSYLEKGRPDAFRADRINYLTDDQFGFAAGVGGIMMREKPAACFYLGTFFAESLILAETGNSVGAIQIAGTAESSQIPFFVAACDYTLIGEELFAASAYLSRNPKEVGALKGQDMGKLAIIVAIIVGTLLISVAQTDVGAQSDMLQWLSQAYMNLLQR